MVSAADPADRSRDHLQANDPAALHREANVVPDILLRKMQVGGA